ncbi:MAG: hypothetical protein VB135_03610 [Burkholderia sp.]
MKISEHLEEEAIDLIAERLRTPLHIEIHMPLVFEQAFRLGTKPVTADKQRGLIPIIRMAAA